MLLGVFFLDSGARRRKLCNMGMASEASVTECDHEVQIVVPKYYVTEAVYPRSLAKPFGSCSLVLFVKGRKECSCHFS